MKKFLSIVLTFILVASVTLTAAVFMISAEDKTADVWDGTIATGFSGTGTGEEGNPYIISTGAELAYISDEVYYGELFEGKYFKLGNDIDLAGRPFNPIGGQSNSYYFGGNFNGNGHTISGFNAVDSKSATNTHVGLFGRVFNGVVRNLTLKGTLTASTKTNFGCIVGALVSSRMYNCVSEVAATVSASAGSSTTIYVGNLVGLAEKESTISYCVSNGSIAASSNSGVTVCAAGIVGRTSGADISYCANKSAVTGNNTKNLMISGIVSAGNSIPETMTYSVMVTDCYNTGALTVGDTVGGTSYAAGITAYASKLVKIKACYNGATIPAADQAGDIVSYSKSEDSTYEDCVFSGAEVAGSTNKAGTFTNNLPGIPMLTQYTEVIDKAVADNIKADADKTAAVEETYVATTPETEDDTENTAPVNTESDTKATQPATESTAAAPVEDTTAATENKGCKGSITAGAGIVTLVSGLALAVTLRKRKEN